MSGLISVNCKKQESENTKSVLTVAKEYAVRPKGVQQMFLQSPSTLISWTNLFFKEIPKSLGRTQSFLKNLNTAIYWIDFPSTFMKMCRAFAEFKDSLFSGSLYTVTEKTNDVFVQTLFTMDLMGGAVSMVHAFEWIELPKAALDGISGIGFGASIALLITTLPQIKEQFLLFIEKEIGSPEFFLAMIRLTAKICLVAIAVFSIISYFYIESISKWVTLSVSTTFLALSLASHFYDEIHVKNGQKPVAL